jgi:hypothetical protein
LAEMSSKGKHGMWKWCEEKESFGTEKWEECRQFPTQAR